MKIQKTIAGILFVFLALDLEQFDDVQVIEKDDFDKDLPDDINSVAIQAVIDGPWKCGIGCTPLSPGHMGYWDSNYKAFYFAESNMLMTFAELNDMKHCFHRIDGTK